MTYKFRTFKDTGANSITYVNLEDHHPIHSTRVQIHEKGDLSPAERYTVFSDGERLISLTDRNNAYRIAKKAARDLKV